MSDLELTDIPQLKELGSIREIFDASKLARDRARVAEHERGHSKVVKDLETAIAASGLKNGMTISFHHHFREGDKVINLVLAKLDEMGFKDLVLAPSSLAAVHAPIVDQIRSGLIRRIETSGMRGDLADAISRGLCEVPVIFRSHGGRASAIASDDLHIDVAFLGAPSCDRFGNANGFSWGARDSEEDDNAPDSVTCGSLGAAMVDARYADRTIILTDNVVSYPNTPFAIGETEVDYVVEVESIGDPKGIMGGATRLTKNPKELLIAMTAANVMEASGYLRDGFSMQTGSGGPALATTRYLKEKMSRANIRADFALGGITSSIVDLYESKMADRLLDVQSFDLAAARSLKANQFHDQISAAYYASPANEGAAVNQLDFVILSALQIDTNFDVNVLTGSDGVVRGAIGGHQDCAAGASVSIVVAPLMRGRIPTVVNQVETVVTPGSTVDIVVTERGVAVNPSRADLHERLVAANIDVKPIDELASYAQKVVGKATPIHYEDRVIGAVTYRDGSLIDTIREVADQEH